MAVCIHTKRATEGRKKKSCMGKCERPSVEKRLLGGLNWQAVHVHLAIVYPLLLDEL
jgi:hypothetical protein